MRTISALATCVGMLVCASALADECKFTDRRSASVDGAGIKRVVIGAGAGDLIVRGAEGRQGVSATGTACASSKDLLDKIRLESRREGDTVHIKTVMPEIDDGWFEWSRAARLDLTIALPRTVAIELADSGGDMEVSDVASAVIADSSGDQTVRNIAGDLDVIDSSGALQIEHVDGNVRVQDNSGDTRISDVRGDVLVSVDSSGDLNIVRAASVRIGTDSSGDIEIAEIDRDVIIEEDSSGDIHVRQVGGNLTVERDGSGSIRHEGVTGTVKVPEESE